MTRIGKKSIQKILPRMKKENYQFINKSIELLASRLKNYGERKLKTVGARYIFCLGQQAPNKEKENGILILPSERR